MPNTYTPPSTINFYTTNFTSSLIYYNYQIAASTVSNGNSVSYSVHSAFTPNAITIPVPGDYVVSWHTGAFSVSATRAYYRCEFTKSGLSTTISGTTLSSGATTVTVSSTAGFPTAGTLLIAAEEVTYTGTTGTTFTGCTRGLNGTLATSHVVGVAVTYILLVGDSTTNIHMTAGAVAEGNNFFRKVTFPSAGAWVLTPQWKPDPSGNLTVSSGSAFYPWVVLIHATNPLDADNQQMTQFLNSSYTVMTNMDASTFWGTQTTTNIINNTNNVVSNTSSISALSTEVNSLSTNVTALQNTVSGLTSISATSGGIRIKP